MKQIAIGIPGFRMRATADWPFRMNEVTISTIAFDEKGVNGSAPSLQINTHELINPVQSWEEVKFAGEGGRLVYGPAEPGAFVYCAAIYVERDDKSRNLGAALEDAVHSDEVKQLMKSLKAIPNPTVQMVTSLAGPVTQLVARILKGNKDDLLFTHQGTFFQNTLPPYNAGDIFTAQNKYISSSLKVIGLDKRDGLESMTVSPLEQSIMGGQPKTISL